MLCNISVSCIKNSFMVLTVVWFYKCLSLFSLFWAIIEVSITNSSLLIIVVPKVRATEEKKLNWILFCTNYCYVLNDLGCYSYFYIICNINRKPALRFFYRVRQVFADLFLLSYLRTVDFMLSLALDEWVHLNIISD